MHLYKYCLKKGIEAKIHYPIPLHLQKASKNLNYSLGSFPNSEQQAKKLITLPVYQFLDKNQINFMIKKIYDYYN